MISENFSNEEKLQNKMDLESSIALINQFQNSFPVVTPKQIKKNTFPESNLSRKHVMEILFPDVGKPYVVKGYNKTHAKKLKLLRDSGILVRIPDVDNNPESRYYLNKKRLVLILKNIEKKIKKINSINLKQHDYYFQ